MSKNEYLKMNLTKDETLKMFKTLGFNIGADSFTTECLNQKCEDYEYDQTDGYDMGEEVLTKDEHVISSFYCNTCKEVTVTTTPAYYFFANLSE